MSTFYYDTKQLYLLTFINSVLLAVVVYLGQFFTDNLWWCSIVTIVCLMAVSSSLFVTFFPQKLASISEKGIKIDHNELLNWEDVATAEKIRHSCLCNREVIIFKLKNNVVYPLTFMQKLCKTSVYGAVSIPLYAMTKSDREKIEQEIKKHINIG